MNTSTILGIILGVTLLTAAIMLQADINFFINLPGIIIVLGGTAAATFISFPLPTVIRGFKVFFIVFKKEPPRLEDHIEQVASLSAKARGDILALEEVVGNVKHPFLRDALEMLIDGYPAEEIREILNERVVYQNIREQEEADIFKNMAKFAPAFGMLGTLIGLIDLLSNMNTGSMDAIGGGMAVALVTTFYGVLLANLLFKPIAVKLEKRKEERALLARMLTASITMIREGWQPFKILDYLNSFVPPAKRKMLERKMSASAGTQ